MKQIEIARALPGAFVVVIHILRISGNINSRFLHSSDDDDRSADSSQRSRCKRGITFQKSSHHYTGNSFLFVASLMVLLQEEVDKTGWRMPLAYSDRV